MGKRLLQKRIAESHFTLPIALFYGIGIWLLAGCVEVQWWLQSAGFVLSTLLMARLNNENMLTRIYSRMVAASFVFLSCIATFLFSSVSGAIAEVSLILALLIIYRGYMAETNIGSVFYAFLVLGIGSLFQINILFFVPCFWVIMAAFIYTFHLRSFLTSLLALVFPYWCLLAWVLVWGKADFSPWIAHFRSLSELSMPFHITAYGIPEQSLFVFLCVAAITGMIHYFRDSYNDKIRVRQIHYSFMFIWWYAAILFLFLLQPHLADLTLRMLTIATSPLIGHFLALTRTKVTNIAFILFWIGAILLTLINLWNSSSIF